MEVSAAMTALSWWEWICTWFAPPPAFSPGELLLRAVRWNDMKTFNFLLGHGVPPDETRTVFGETALLIAARFGRKEMAFKLMEAGADPAVQDCTYNTPLGKAAASGHSDIIRRMAVAHPSLFKMVFAAKALRMACYAGHSQAVVALLECGTPPDIPLLGFPTALFIAATIDPKCTYELLDAGADVHAVDEHGQTPLHHAARADANICARILLGFNSHLEPKDYKGRTPMDVATSGSMRQLLGPLPPLLPYALRKSGPAIRAAKAKLAAKAAAKAAAEAAAKATSAPSASGASCATSAPSASGASCATSAPSASGASCATSAPSASGASCATSASSASGAGEARHKTNES